VGREVMCRGEKKTIQKKKKRGNTTLAKEEEY